MKPAAPQNYVQTEQPEEPNTLAIARPGGSYVSYRMRFHRNVCAEFTLGLSNAIHNVKHTLGSM